MSPMMVEGIFVGHGRRQFLVQAWGCGGACNCFSATDDDSVNEGYTWTPPVFTPGLRVSESRTYLHVIDEGTGS